MGLTKEEAAKILDCGVDDDADAIKKKYRKLALKLHPDKTNGATSELFAALTEAHKAVSGERRRARPAWMRRSTSTSRCFQMRLPESICSISSSRVANCSAKT